MSKRVEVIEEVRYVVEDDYSSKLRVTSVPGRVREKTVAVAGQRAIRWRSVISRVEWDSMARTPEEAMREYVKLKQHEVESLQRRLDLARKDASAAYEFYRSNVDEKFLKALEKGGEKDGA